MSQPTEIRRQGIPERVGPSGIATRVVEDEQVTRRPARASPPVDERVGAQPGRRGLGRHPAGAHPDRDLRPPIQLITHTTPIQQDLLNTYASPSREHLLGTDELGRDTLTRLVYGARISLGIGFLAVSVALVIGGSSASAPGSTGGGWTMC